MYDLKRVSSNYNQFTSFHHEDHEEKEEFLATDFTDLHG
jgi:hypothetical protein